MATPPRCKLPWKQVTNIDDIELPPPTPRTANTFLIHDHYRRMGCFTWDRMRFMRLAAAGGFTPAELGARVGIDAADVERCCARGKFPKPVGILLTLHERFIRQLKTGYTDGQDLFPPLQ